MYSKIINSFKEEYNHFILWLPVFFAIGIIYNLSRNYEPNIYYVIPILFLLLIAILLSIKHKIINYIIIIIFLTIFGFFITIVRINIVESPILNYDIKYCKIEGELSKIIPSYDGYRIVIDNPIIKNHNQLNLKKIRINIKIKSNLDDINLGDYIKISAALSPPPKSNIIGGYNFAFKSYFDRIGAVGYGLSNIKVIKKTKKNYLDNLRKRIGSSIINIMESKNGNIATALMIGEYNGIDKQILNNMRISGISHILSVSGMHLSLAALIFLFSFRIILNLHPSISNNLNVKKISSLIAIFGSLFYLLISGTQIAAVRSFIMTLMIMIAIIIDRLSTPIRSVMFAFFVILLFYPESILDPSFQMSFSAVIALISCYEFYFNNMILANNSNILFKIFIYVYSTLFSSVVASIATAPFAAYHFNQFSGYGVIANLIAVPVTSFFIMPPLIIAFLLYPINLHAIPLKIMGFGTNILIKLAAYITTMPMSVSKIPYISPLCIIIFTISGLWFTLWKCKIRYFSILILLLAIIIYITTQKADIIASNKIYGYVNDEKQFIFASNKIRGFTKESWLNYYGQKDSKYYHLDDDQYNCDDISCKYHKNNYNIIFLKGKLENRDCIYYDLIIDYSGNDFIANCEGVKYLKIERNIYLIYLRDKIKIDNLNQDIGNRKWNIENRLR